MNHLQKHLSASLIALAALLSATPMAMAAPASSLSNFAILSAAPMDQGTYSSIGAVALTGSVINGDVGSSGPLASVVLVNSTVNGSIIAPVSAGVVDAFNTALSNGLALPCDQYFSANAYTGVTLHLASGVTCSNTAAVTFTNTTLVLDGSGPWTVVVSSAPAADGSRTGALTGTDLNVVMGDGSAVPCDAVTWYVAQAASLTVDAVTVPATNFVGTIYAGAAITFVGVAGSTAASTINGDALAGAKVKVTDTTVTACTTIKGHHYGQRKEKCNQGVGNGDEGCDPGHSDRHNPWGSNDENGGTPGHPGRKGGNN